MYHIGRRNGPPLINKRENIMTTITDKQQKVIADVAAVASLAIIGTYYDTTRPSALHEVAAIAAVGVLFYVGKKYVGPVIAKLTPWKKD